MKKRISWVLALIWALSIVTACGNSNSRKGSRLNDETPPINEEHIFNGEYKSNGKVVGFHSRPDGKNPPNAKVIEINDGPNALGVYTAEVKICKTAAHLKCGIKNSSFFPNKLSRNEVLKVISHAYDNRTTGSAMKFSGPSGLGFTVDGYTLGSGDDLIINTAFPIYTAVR